MNGPMRPESSPDQLRTIADWLDNIQNAIGIKSQRSIQEDLRRIADEYEYLECEYLEGRNG